MAIKAFMTPVKTGLCAACKSSINQYLSRAQNIWNWLSFACSFVRKGVSSCNPALDSTSKFLWILRILNYSTIEHTCNKGMPGSKPGFVSSLTAFFSGWIITLRLDSLHTEFENLSRRRRASKTSQERLWVLMRCKQVKRESKEVSSSHWGNRAVWRRMCPSCLLQSRTKALIWTQQQCLSRLAGLRLRLQPQLHFQM